MKLSKNIETILDQLHEISINIIPSGKQTFTVCYWRWIFPWFHGDLLVDLVGPITSAGTTTKKSLNLAALRGRQGRARIRRTCILCMMNWLLIIWLVVDQPLWKIWKSVGIIIPNIWKNKNVWNHQPEFLLPALKSPIICIYSLLSCQYITWSDGFCCPCTNLFE